MGADTAGEKVKEREKKKKRKQRIRCRRLILLWHVGATLTLVCVTTIVAANAVVLLLKRWLSVITPNIF